MELMKMTTENLNRHSLAVARADKSLLFLKNTCTPRETEGNFSAEESMLVTQSNRSDSDDDDENSSPS